MLKVSEGIPQHIEAAEDAYEAFPDFVLEGLNQDDESAYYSGDAGYSGEDDQENVHGGSLS